MAWPALAQGRVLYPHGNAVEVGEQTGELREVSRLFADQTNLYVPEMHAHLSVPHAGWIATWNPHNGLGRPLFPSGFGPAHPVGHVLGKVTSDAFRYYTFWSLAAVWGTGLFAYLFLRALGLHAAACLLGAAGLSFGPVFGGWQIVPLIQWGFCWTFAALYGVECWLRRPSVWCWLGIAFAVYSILLLGFLQHTILLGWGVLGWIVVRTSSQCPSRRAKQAAWAAFTGAAMLGIVCVLPVYLDLFVDWKQSARAGYTALSAPMSAQGIERHRTLFGLVAWPWPEEGGRATTTLTPLFAGLAVLGLLWRQRLAAGLLVVWASTAILADLSSTVTRALRWIGLFLSEWPAIYGGMVPLMILAAFGADTALRAGKCARWVRIGLASAPLLAAVALGSWIQKPLTLVYLWLPIALGAGLLVFCWRPRGGLLIALLAVTAVSSSGRLIFWQGRGDIQTDSPLVERIRALTGEETRFAWVGPRPEGNRLLEPNQEILLGLTSVHSYDHLVSQAFSETTRRFGGEAYSTNVYDRRFRELRPEAVAHQAFLSLSSIAVLLSRDPLPDLDEQRFQAAGDVRGVHLTRVRNAGPWARLLPTSAIVMQVAGARVAEGGLQAGSAVHAQQPRLADRVWIQIAPRPDPHWLVVSQRIHPHWKAWVDGEPVPVVPVNNVFQAIHLPASSRVVEMRLERWVRFSWLPQVFFGMASVLWAWGVLRGRLVGGSPRTGGVR